MYVYDFDSTTLILLMSTPFNINKFDLLHFQTSPRFQRVSHWIFITKIFEYTLEYTRLQHYLATVALQSSGKSVDNSGCDAVLLREFINQREREREGERERVRERERGERERERERERGREREGEREGGGESE